MKKFLSAIMSIVCIIMLSVPVSALGVSEDAIVVGEPKIIREGITEVGVIAKDGSLVCSCGLSISDAYKHVTTSNMDARGIPCICGGDIRTTVIGTSSWNPSGNDRACTHGKHGHDYEYTQTTYLENKCNSCTYYALLERVSSKWECRGFM